MQVWYGKLIGWDWSQYNVVNMKAISIKGSLHGQQTEADFNEQLASYRPRWIEPFGARVKASHDCLRFQSFLKTMLEVF